MIILHKIPLEHTRKREDFDYNFNNVIFTNESMCQVYRCTRKMWVKYGHCQKLVPTFSPAVTLRGCISKLGLSPLVLVNENIPSVQFCRKTSYTEPLINNTLSFFSRIIPYQASFPVYSEEVGWWSSHRLLTQHIVNLLYNLSLFKYSTYLFLKL